MDHYTSNIHIERSFAQQDIASSSEHGRVRRFRQKAPPWTFKVPYIWRILLGAVSGLLLLSGGMGLSVISYNSAFATTNAANSTSNSTLFNTHLTATVRSFSVIGPIFMALGFFVVMTAYVLYMEFRDKYYRFLGSENLSELSEKQVFALILQQFRRTYFHGIALPLGKPTAATNTYPAGIDIAENTDELLERLSPRFLKAEKEADEVLKIPHDSEVTLAYLAHVPGEAGKESSSFSNLFSNKNIYSPFNVKKSYNKSITQKSTLSLKNADRRTNMLREFGDRKSYSLDVPKPVTDGSHENLAYTSEDELTGVPVAGLRRQHAVSAAISSDNESNQSDSVYPSVIVHEASVHRRSSSYGVSAIEPVTHTPVSFNGENECIGAPDAPRTAPTRHFSEFDDSRHGLTKASKNRRFSEFGVVGSLSNHKRVEKRRLSEYGVVGVLGDNKNSGSRRRSEFCVSGLLDYPKNTTNNTSSDYGVVGALDGATTSQSQRCSEYGVIGFNQNQYTTESSMDTDSSSQNAYTTIINIAQSEIMSPGTFSGQNARRKSIISQCSVCNNDVLLDFDECDNTDNADNADNDCIKSVAADKLSNEIFGNLSSRPSLAERRSSFRNTYSKQNLREPRVGNLEKPRYGERRVSFDPRTPTIERSRSCSSKVSLDESYPSADKLVSKISSQNSLRVSPYQSNSDFLLTHASSGSIDRTISPKRKFLSPNQSIDDFNRKSNTSSPLGYDYGQSTSDLSRSRKSLDRAHLLNERRGSFDPRKTCAQNSASSRRKSFVGSDSDSMEFRISIDRVDDEPPRRPKQRGRSLQVRSSRSNLRTKHTRNKSLKQAPVRSSITFKCGIEELRHTPFSMSQDDTEPILKSQNFLTPDYQPR